VVLTGFGCRTASGRDRAQIDEGAEARDGDALQRLLRRHVAIAAVARLAAARQPRCLDVDEPAFGYAMAGKQRQLHVAVAGEARRRLHHHEMNVRSGRQGIRIAIASWAQDRDVRLRLGEVVRTDGVLHRDGRRTPERRRELAGEHVHDAGVLRTDGRHVDHLAVDELDPGVGGQDSGIPHAVEVGDGVAVATRRCSGGAGHGGWVTAGGNLSSGACPGRFNR
jgi:hypothetical protein